MRVGADNEGREILYDDKTNTWSIGGISSSLEKVMAYHRGGQVKWDSPEIQQWAYEAEQTRQAHVANQSQAQQQSQQEQAARQAEEARRRSLTVQGYDPATSVKLAGALNSIATLIVVAFIVTGVINGLIVGLVAARQFPLGVILFPLIFGVTGWLIGWLSVLLIRVIAQGLVTVTQIEANTRRD